jgi:uncharacterized membrane protein
MWINWYAEVGRMNRAEFLSQLEQHLVGISPDEIRDVIAYYNEYFDDAGPENEAKVINELISPYRLAAQIKAESAVRGLNENESPPPMKNGISAIWWVALGILALPIALPLVFGAFGVLIGLSAAAFGVIVALFAAGIAALFSGFVVVILGILAIPIHLPTGIFYLGIGLLAIGFSFLLGLLVYVLAKGLIYFIAWAMNNIRRRSSNRIRSRRMKGGLRYE